MSRYDIKWSMIGRQNVVVEPKKRARKGEISVINDKGWLRLRWSHQGKRYVMAVGLLDTPANRPLAEAKAGIIRADILSGQFDKSLVKYRYETSESLTVLEVYEKFVNWKRRQVTKRSLDKYLGLRSHLETFFGSRQAARVIEDHALDYRDWLLKRLSPATARERIGMMRSCWSWAIGRKLLAENPWENVRVKAPPKQKPRPFTQDEYKRIIDTFRELHSNYLDFIQFLMGVGCRPGEAAGLRWRHVSENCDRIWIGESWGRGERKPTKTNESRAFKLSPDLAEMLRARRPAAARDDDLVFTSSEGKPIDDHNFRRRHWVPALDVASVPYRKPYNTRHSFISQALDQGWSVSEIASITGNSEETILRSYVGSVRGEAELKSVWDDQKDLST
ncbi:MAG: tyrosine-type recombinase/integrase [Cyanobacteria bacterium J06627_3]